MAGAPRLYFAAWRSYYRIRAARCWQRFWSGSTAAPTEELLKLYWNRADVKREVKALRRERFELLDKLKEQEGAILRAQEQLEGLERLLTNPLAAANAMVYFQLRHLWRVGAQRLEQFGRELQTAAREARARAAAGRRDREARSGGSMPSRRRWRGSPRSAGRGRGASASRAEAREHEQLSCACSARARSSDQIAGLQSGRQMLEEKLEELRALTEKIQGEPLPEPEGMSLDSRRLINTAVIALAQHLVVHFSEHDLASLAKTQPSGPSADMKFGDRRDCDRMVERIREKIEELKQQKTLRRSSQAAHGSAADRDQVSQRHGFRARRRVPADDQPHAGRASQRARDGAAHERRAAAHQRASPTTTGICWP